MTDQQSRAAMEFHLGSVYPKKAPETPLFQAFGSDFRHGPAAALSFLAEAADERSANDIESMLVICGHFGALTSEAVPLLCRLLLDDSHSRHEDIARYLQNLRDERSIQPLFDACFLNLPHFYDDGDALARKCTWALHDIGTFEAVGALLKLTRFARPAVVEYAKKRL